MSADWDCEWRTPRSEARDKAAARRVNKKFAERNATPVGEPSTDVVRHVDIHGPCACSCAQLCPADHTPEPVVEDEDEETTTWASWPQALLWHSARWLAFLWTLPDPPRAPGSSPSPITTSP